jgi:hypothetical protein
MDSNPHVRQLSRSEDDPFQVSESLGQLQLADSAEDVTSPSTPTRSTLPSTQRKVSIPERALRVVCNTLERLIQPGDDDDRIQDSLETVWCNVHKALKEDSIMKPRLADEDGFKKNVQTYGEKQFIDLLKDMAKKKNWQDLLENGTSSLSSGLKPSNRGLSQDVFLKPEEREERGWNTTPASMDGAK